MELFIGFLAIALFLLFLSINIKNLSQAFIIFTSILFLVMGVLILFNGDVLFSNSFTESYTYVDEITPHDQLEIVSITTTPVPNTSPFIEVLGLFSLLSAIYIFLLGAFKEE